MWINRRKFLRGAYRIETVEGAGWERVSEIVEAGDAVLLAPNHADHADPHVLVEVAAQHGVGQEHTAPTQQQAPKGHRIAMGRSRLP